MDSKVEESEEVEDNQMEDSKDEEDNVEEENCENEDDENGENEDENNVEEDNAEEEKNSAAEKDTSLALTVTSDEINKLDEFMENNGASKNKDDLDDAGEENINNENVPDEEEISMMNDEKNYVENFEANDEESFDSPQEKTKHEIKQKRQPSADEERIPLHFRNFNKSESRFQQLLLVQKAPNTFTKLNFRYITITRRTGNEDSIFKRLLIHGLQMGDLFNSTLYTLIQLSERHNFSYKFTEKSGLQRFSAKHHLIDVVEMWKMTDREVPPPCKSTDPERQILARQLVLKNVPESVGETEILNAYKMVEKVEFVKDYQKTRCATLTFVDVFFCHVAHSRQYETKINDEFMETYLMAEMASKTQFMPLKLKEETEEETQTRNTFNVLWYSMLATVEEMRAKRSVDVQESVNDSNTNTQMSRRARAKFNKQARGQEQEQEQQEEENVVNDGGNAAAESVKEKVATDNTKSPTNKASSQQTQPKNSPAVNKNQQQNKQPPAGKQQQQQQQQQQQSNKRPADGGNFPKKDNVYSGPQKKKMRFDGQGGGFQQNTQKSGGGFKQHQQGNDFMAKKRQKRMMSRQTKDEQPNANTPRFGGRGRGASFRGRGASVAPWAAGSNFASRGGNRGFGGANRGSRSASGGFQRNSATNYVDFDYGGGGMPGNTAMNPTAFGMEGMAPYSTGYGGAASNAAFFSTGFGGDVNMNMGGMSPPRNQPYGRQPNLPRNNAMNNPGGFKRYFDYQ